MTTPRFPCFAKRSPDRIVRPLLNSENAPLRVDRARLPSVWGEDADKWNPDRFARLDMDKQVKVGVYANL